MKETIQIRQAREARRIVSELESAAAAYGKTYDAWLNADKGVRFDKPRKESWEATRTRLADELPERRDRLRTLIASVGARLEDRCPVCGGTADDPQPEPPEVTGEGTYGDTCTAPFHDEEEGR